MEIHREASFPQDVELLGVLESLIGKGSNELYIAKKFSDSPVTTEIRPPQTALQKLDQAMILRALSTSLSGVLTFRTATHREISQAGLSAQLKNFTPQDIATIVNANLDQDKWDEGQPHPEYHFDNNKLLAGKVYVDSQYALIRATSNPQEALEAFGKILHAQQDFYAHTNFVELYRDYFHQHSGHYPLPREIPLYQDALKNPQLRTILQTQLKSGEFSRAEFILKDLFHLNHDPNSHEMMNKDGPGRPLYPEAKDLAERQTGKEIEKFLKTIRKNFRIKSFFEKNPATDG